MCNMFYKDFEYNAKRIVSVLILHINLSETLTPYNPITNLNNDKTWKNMENTPQPSPSRSVDPYRWRFIRRSIFFCFFSSTSGGGAKNHGDRIFTHSM